MPASSTIDLRQAEQQLPELIAEARRSGHPFIITDNGEILAQILPLPRQGKRQMGTLRGKIRIPDDFDDIASDEIALLFYGRTSCEGQNSKSSAISIPLPLAGEGQG